MKSISLFSFLLLLSYKTFTPFQCQATSLINRVKEAVGGTTQLSSDYSLEKEFSKSYRNIEKKANAIANKANSAQGLTTHIPDELKDFNAKEERRINEIDGDLAALKVLCDSLREKIEGSKYFSQYSLPIGEIKKDSTKGPDAYLISMPLPHFKKSEIKVEIITKRGEANYLTIYATREISDKKEQETLENMPKELTGKIEQTTPLLTYLKSFFRNVEKGKSSLSIICKNQKLDIKATHELPYSVKVKEIDIRAKSVARLDKDNILRIRLPTQEKTKDKSQKNKKLHLNIE